MRTPVTKRELSTVGRYLQGLLAAQALERQVQARAAELERQLAQDAKLLRQALRRETDEFRQRRLEAAYLYCVQRLAAMRRAQALARNTIADTRRILPRALLQRGK